MISTLQTPEIYLRLAAIAVGWILGNFMTAQVIALVKTHGPAARIGDTGNPGMANIMANLGFKPGICVLIGDLLKTGLACLAGYFIMRSANVSPALDLPGIQLAGRLGILYGGTGAVVGHNFPLCFGLIMNLLRRGKDTKEDRRTYYKGGKGVASTCLTVFLFSPLHGILSVIAGMLVVFATQYLCIGGIEIPAVFTVLAFIFFSKEAGWIGVFLTLLMIQRNLRSLKGIRTGETKKDNVLGAIRKKLSKKHNTKKA